MCRFIQYYAQPLRCKYWASILTGGPGKPGGPIKPGGPMSP